MLGRAGLNVTNYKWNSVGLFLVDVLRALLRAVEKAITQRDIDQPTAVSDHVTLPGHSLNNLELIPLELINSNRDAIPKAREAFLIYKGKTLEPTGMNRRDEI